jgi:hypothetical protein
MVECQLYAPKILVRLCIFRRGLFIKKSTLQWVDFRFEVWFRVWGFKKSPGTGDFMRFWRGQNRVFSYLDTI